MFDTLTSLTKAAVGVALTPVDAVADALTMGGELTDRQESYTGERLKAVAKNLERATDPD